MTLGEYIKQYRQMHKMSQREFAICSGLSNTYISHLERGTNSNGSPVTPSLETYQAIASATGCTARDLIDLLDDEKKEAQKPLVNNDPELTELLTRARDDPNIRMLFSVTKNATAKDIEQAIKIIQALKGE
ncbi:MAG: helix-turn-helix domain-containing protein [Lachnospiraceae bacterium]|nr:helix-turn-helix domain-containing protein [Lachnospiraceae bacterium]